MTHGTQGMMGLTASCLLAFFLCSCNIYPDPHDNEFTGQGAGVVGGAAIGAGGTALLGATQPIPWYGAIVGGGLGYYYTSIRGQSAGIIHAGGQVYTEGDMLGIEIPSDSLFDPGSSMLLPSAREPLNSAADILERFPNSNIVVLAGTDGFMGGSYAEYQLSVRQAKEVSGFLWSRGITATTASNIQKTRDLTYVGYGDRLPIANSITAKGITSNRRIQIMVTPNIHPVHKVAGCCGNIGALSDSMQYDFVQHDATQPIQAPPVPKIPNLP